MSLRDVADVRRRRSLRVVALLDAGVEPEDLARTRRQAGADADCEQVLARLEQRHPGQPATVVPAGLHVNGGAPDLPPKLADTWEEGGPLWLWRQGDQDDWARPRPAVGIVGTRRPTLDGTDLAGRIAAGLAEAGVTVVSGFAVGIDQAAHRGALATGGRTIAVLGTGLSIDYPHGCRQLRDRVRRSGGLVSEYAAGRGIRHRGQFPARNRILAGLSDAVVVVEAGSRSGALNTASWAADFGREVMVVPASPSSRSAAGALALLRDGATPVRSAADVLESLGQLAHLAGDGPGVAHARTPDVPESAAAVLNLLSPVPASISRLAERTGRSAREVLVAVSQLEANGLAQRTAAGVVRT